MKRAVVVFISLMMIFVGLLSHQLANRTRAGSIVAEDTSDTGYEYYNEQNEEKEDSAMSKTQKKKKSALIPVDTKEDSITVLVNRKYRLSADYIPADLVVPQVRFSFYGTYEKSYVRKVAAEALEKLFAEAEQEGVVLKAVSGYRSYARQKEIYDRNVSSRGETATDLVSAKPGSSEHQTGLTIDVSSEAVDCGLEESFGQTADGKWLAANCHKYGFIIRYPKDKTEITGYSYEPWHIRYVGKKLATYLYRKNLTLEEYYSTTTVDEQIVEPEGEIHDMADDEKKEPQMTAAPTPKPDRKPQTVRKVEDSEETAAPTASEKAKKPKKPARKPSAGATKKPTVDSGKKPDTKPTKKPAPTQDSSTESIESTTPTAVPQEVQTPQTDPQTNAPTEASQQETPAGTDGTTE